MKSDRILELTTAQSLPVQFKVSHPHPTDVFWASTPQGKGYKKKLEIPENVSEIWVSVIYFEDKDATRTYKITYEKLNAPFGLVDV
ncbi:hypothetical protein [Streptomyces sp. 900105245]